MSAREEAVLRILVVSDDAVVRGRVALALAGAGDELLSAATIDEAITLASTGEIALAFVDVGSEGSAALALVHHLLAIRGEATVIALVPRASMDLGVQALALGARSIVMSPPNGDAVLTAVSAVRARRLETLALVEARAELGLTQRRAELVHRIIALAAGSDAATPPVHADPPGPTDEALHAMCEATGELAGARGAAVFYVPPGGDLGCTRRAAIGNGREYPDILDTHDLLAQARSRGAVVIRAEAKGRLRGLLVVDDPRPDTHAVLARLAELSAVVLALDAEEGRAARAAIKDTRGRVYTPELLADAATREIAKATRHGRRVTLLSFSGEPRSRARLEDVILDSVRSTDVLAAIDDRTLCLLLPETTTPGAHQCRRRVVRALAGDRRAVQSASEKRLGRAPSSSLEVQGLPRVLGAGTATYPHDGRVFDRLLAISRARAAEDTKSLAHVLGLELLDLSEIVDRLLERPMLDAGARSPYPLDLAPEALPDLVLSASREMRRGGVTQVHVTMDSATDCAAAVRAAFAADDLTQASVYDVQAEHAQVTAAAVVGEMGAWVCCGRTVKARFRGVHTFDPLLSDVIVECLRDTAASVAR